MERRDVLKLLASAVLPTLNEDALLLLQGVHAQIAKASPSKALDPHQDATVSTIAELIIPQTDTPGAKAAKVNEFIDLILTEWYDEPARVLFLAGLTDVDKRSHSMFGKQFVSCAEIDQKKLLTVLDEEALAARKNQAAPPIANPTNFFGMMKRLTLVGYYTSEVGFKDELHRSILPPTHKGCTVIKGAA